MSPSFRLLGAISLSVLLTPRPAATGARPGRGPPATTCHCAPDIYTGRYNCYYSFYILQWGAYPCGEQFLKDAGDFCDSQPDTYMYSDIFIYSQAFDDAYHCSSYFSIYRPFCVEDFVKEIMRCDKKFEGVMEISCSYDTEENLKNISGWDQE